MKKTIVMRLVGLFMAVPLFFGCNDKAPYYGEGIDSAFNKLYSNKNNKNHVTGDLELTYSDRELSGKEVYFNLMTENSATIKFFSLFPGEEESVIENLRVNQRPNGYSFSGTYMTSGNTSFVCEGRLAQNGKNDFLMSLTVTDVRIPAGVLSTGGSFKTVGWNSYKDPITQESYEGTPAYFEWTYVDNAGQIRDVLDLDGMNVTDMVSNLLSNFVYLAVDELRFLRDGNITSTFCRLPDELNLMELIEPDAVSAADRGQSELSPVNLVNYYERGTTVYIKPDIEMIVNLINSNKGNLPDEGETDGDGDTDGDDNGLDINIGINTDLTKILSLVTKVINDFYPELNRWAKQGLQFKLAEVEKETIDGNGDTVYNDADYLLYLDETELKHIITLIPDILSLLEIDLGGMDLSEILGEDFELDEIIEMISSRIDTMHKMKVGIYLRNN